jgi:hypothetical protein
MVPFPTRAVVLGALAVAMSGCATPTFTLPQAVERTAERTAEATRDIARTPRAVARVRELHEPYIEFRRVAAPTRRGDVNVRAASSPFGVLVSEISRQAGYSLVLAETVDAARKVTVDFRDAQAEDAIRTTAFLAGYVAVVDRERRTITVAETATYTFKLPAGVFSQLQAVYAAGGNATNSGTSTSSGTGSTSGAFSGPPGLSGSSSGSAGSGGGSSVQASFTISGREAVASQSVQRLIAEVAGPNAQVVVTEMGFISVRANGQALRRVNDFLKRVSADAMTQVDIEAAVVEVSLAHEFAYGIDWKKVLARASGSTYAVAAGAADLLGANVSVTRTGASTTTIVQALNRFTDTQVVSQPRLFTMNNTPANFIQGTQVPYLGNIQQTQSSGVGVAPTTSGSVAFAIDGISFGVVPSVIDGKHVQISLMPVISTLGEAEQFALGESAMLKAYRQSNKQTFMRVMAESGQTLVLGGIRQGAQSADTELGTSARRRGNATEVVILLRATVVPAPDYDPLAGESL